MTSEVTTTYRFPEFDRQTMFNKAFLGLASQGFKRSAKPRYNLGADDENSLCLYRGPEGRKCAVGWMIPDDAYHEDMEAQTASNLIKGESVDDMTWLNDLQGVHDYVRSDMKSMEERLRKFAADYGLTVPDLSVAA